MHYGMAKSLLESGNDAVFFSLFGLISFVLMLVGSVFMAQTQIFEAKDNELLLSMPIPPRYIFLSRIISLAVVNLVYESVISIPCFVLYCIFGQVTVLGVVSFIILSLVLPLFSMAITILFAWMLSSITARVRHKTAFQMALSILLIGLWYAFYMVLSNGGIASNMQWALSVSLIKWFSEGIASANMLYVLYFVLVGVGAFALVCFVLSLNFIKITTMNKGAPKAVYKEKKSKVKGASSALLRREFRRFTSSSTYMLNCGFGLIFILAIAVFAIVKSDSLPVISLGKNFPIDVSVLFALGIIFIQSSTPISAPSVSFEGKSLWIIQSLPVRGADVLRAKVLMHVLAEAPVTLISSAIIAVIFHSDVLSTVFVLIAPFLMCLFIAVLGVFVNLKFPRFDWDNEAMIVKRGASVGITMGIGYAVTFLPVIAVMIPIFAGAAGDVVMSIMKISMITFPSALAIATILMYSNIVRRGNEKFTLLGQ